MTEIKWAREAPDNLQQAAKVALAVGAACMLNSDRDSLAVKFRGSDVYTFDPANVTLHCLELLGEAKTYGFVEYRHTDTGVMMLRQPLVVRIVSSQQDVRVQIGASRWYASKRDKLTTALRESIVTAFADYYDQVIAPYAAS